MSERCQSCSAFADEPHRGGCLSERIRTLSQEVRRLKLLAGEPIEGEEVRGRQGYLYDDVMRVVNAALREARQEEREACAQHIEREMYQLDTGEVAAMGPLEHYNVVLREMADSIRARTQESEG